MKERRDYSGVELKVVLLEDNPDDAELVQNELVRAGFRPSVVRVNNLEDLSKALSPPPDVILADYALPACSGLDAIEVRDRIAPDAPLIIVSGTIGEEVAVECMRAGATDYVLKDKRFRLGPVVRRALEDSESLKIRRRAEWELERIFDLSLDMICVTDFRGCFKRVNRAFARVLGYPETELLSRSCYDYIHPDDREKTRRVLTEVLGAGAPVVGFVNRFRHRDGTYRWLEWNSQPVVEEGSTYAVARDITGSREAQRRLRESEDKLRLALSAARMGIWDWDIETGSVIWTDGVEAIFGLAPGAFAGTYGAYLDLIHPDDSERVRNTVDGVVCGDDPAGHYEIEHRLIRPDGSIGWLAATGRLFRGERGEAVRMVGTAWDITEHKETERRIRESETRYRELVENINDAIFSLRSDGTITYISPAIETIAGYTPPDLVGRNFREFVHPEDIEGIDVSFRNVMEGKIEPSEYRVLTASGGERWVRTSSRPLRDGGSPVGITGSITDIDERKRVEAALIETESKYLTLFRAARDGIVLLDLETGTVAECNPEFERQAGRTQAELKKMKIWELRPPEKVEASRLKFFEIQKRGYGGADDLELLRPDGTVVPVEFEGKEVEWGGRSYIQEHFRDVTERKKAEESLRQREEENLRLQKMDAVGRLAGGVAHDFNNLLTAIMGFVDLVLSELPEGSPYRSDLLEVEAAARRGGLLTRQLLAFSRKQTLFKKMLDLNRLVQGMEVMLRSLLSEDIEIDIDLDPELKNVRADAGQIEQVAMNLVINARDAMPAGGRLTVRTENVALDEESSREIRESRPGEFACLTVEDTGTGMSGEIQQRIFEPFFTTKGPEKGTGLGLSTVYGIVKQHGGWVNFYSEPKRGTVFRVYLPTLSTPAAAKARESFPSEYSPGKGERILLVEDNEGILKSQLRILQRAGYVVFGAGTAAEARDLFRREEGNFDLFFTDVVLPDGNGLELVEELRKRVPALRVLLSSGYIDLRENGDRIRELGLPFIEKPYQIRPLLNRIRAELDRPATGP